MGVEVSHDYIAIMEVKKKVKVRCEIRGPTGYRGDVNIVMVTDGNLITFITADGNLYYLHHRTADGSCNNLAQPQWGTSNRPFRRMFLPSYEDGEFCLILTSIIEPFDL